MKPNKKPAPTPTTASRDPRTVNPIQEPASRVPPNLIHPTTPGLSPIAAGGQDPAPQDQPQKDVALKALDDATIDCRVNGKTDARINAVLDAVARCLHLGLKLDINEVAQNAGLEPTELDDLEARHPDTRGRRFGTRRPNVTGPADRSPNDPDIDGVRENNSRRSNTDGDRDNDGINDRDDVDNGLGDPSNPNPNARRRSTGRPANDPTGDAVGLNREVDGLNRNPVDGPHRNAGNVVDPLRPANTNNLRQPNRDPGNDFDRTDGDDDLRVPNNTVDRSTGTRDPNHQNDDVIDGQTSNQRRASRAGTFNDAGQPIGGRDRNVDDIDVPFVDDDNSQAAIEHRPEPDPLELVLIGEDKNQYMVPLYNPQAFPVTMTYDGDAWTIRARGVDLVTPAAANHFVGASSGGAGKMSNLGVRRLYSPEPRLDGAAERSEQSARAFCEERNRGVRLLADEFAKRNPLGKQPSPRS